MLFSYSKCINDCLFDGSFECSFFLVVGGGGGIWICGCRSYHYMIAFGLHVTLAKYFKIGFALHIMVAYDILFLGLT